VSIEGQLLALRVKADYLLTAACQLFLNASASFHQMMLKWFIAPVCAYGAFVALVYVAQRRLLQYFP
jgi:hypothetical protein